MSETNINRRSLLLAILMLVLALILPFAYRIDVGPGPDSIRAMVWDYIEASWYTGFRFWNPFDTLLFTFLRIIFSLFLVRVYVGKTTAQRAVFIGILAEMQPLLVSAPLVYLIDWPGDAMVPLYIPLPFMLIIGIILLLAFQRRSKIRLHNSLQSLRNN